MKKIILIISLICASICVYGQDVQIGNVSPQTADFMKYGDIPVSIYTGQVNLSVPIYHYRDKSFDIPIELVYTSDGLKPSKHSGYAGYNWRLDAGGSITREVYGVADDIYDSSNPPNATYRNCGFYWATLERNIEKDLLWSFSEKVFNNKKDLGYTIPRLTEEKDTRGYDHQPDYFMVNACGHKISFMVDAGGQVITNKKGYKVKLNWEKQYSEQSDINSSSIDVTTPDGTILTFGGDPASYLEYTRTFNNGNNPMFIDNAQIPIITAWHLREIKAIDGKVATFTYKTCKIYKGSKESQENFWYSTKDNLAVGAGSATKAVYLEYISVDGTNISFWSSIEKALPLYDNSSNAFLLPTYQLDAIKVFVGSEERASYTLNYDIQYTKTTGNNRKADRRFLSSIDQKGVGSYEFSYNHPSYSYPEPFHHATLNFIDKHGYSKTWNNLGVLTKVAYPTGGHSEFSYEKNSYSQKAEIIIPDKIARLYPETKSVGGVRLTSVKNYSENGKLAFSKTYHYVNNYKSYANLNDLESSGILLQTTPKYGGAELISDIWTKNYNIGESHIGYSSVAEVTDDGSYSIHTFSDFRDNPDEYGDMKFSPNTDVSELSAAPMIATGISRSTSNGKLRGHLLKKAYYDNNDKLISKKLYKYKGVRGVSDYEIPASLLPTYPEETDLTSTNDYVITLREVLDSKAGKYMSIIKKVYLTDHLLLIEYDVTDGIINQAEYTYNSLGLIEEKHQLIENGSLLTTSYIYLGEDKTGSNISNIASQRNILTPIVSEKLFKDKTLLSQTVNTYKENKIPLGFINPIVIDSVKMAKGNNSLETRFVFAEYDVNNNPAYVISDDSIHTCYVWNSYGEILAVIKNAKYTEVKKLLDRKGLPLSTTNFQRDLPNALITTYTQKPFVGILQAANTQGLSTYYNYDDMFRLKDVKDNDSIYLAAYRYHTAGNKSVKPKISINTPTAMRDSFGIPIFYTFDKQTSISTEIIPNITTGVEYCIELYKLDNDWRQIPNTSPDRILKSSISSSDFMFEKTGKVRIDASVTVRSRWGTATDKTSQYIKVFNGPIELELPMDTTIDNNTTLYVPATVKGGSKDFAYTWYLYDGSGSLLESTGTSRQNVYSSCLTEEGERTLTCIVKDLDDGKEASISKRFTVLPEVSILGWKNTSKNVASNKSSVTVKGELYCSTPISVTFLYNLVNDASTTNVTYKIGSRTYTLSANGSNSVTIDLPAGITKAEIILNNPSNTTQAVLNLANSSKGYIDAMNRALKASLQ